MSEHEGGRPPESLRIWPAIDLIEGRCVRLLRGDFGASTSYGDPVEIARAYVARGASGLHVVDLDAARTGSAANTASVVGIVEATSVPVQLGGGLRDFAAIDAAFRAGVARVVLGTAAVERPDFARAAARAYPGRVVVGFDHRRVGEGRAQRRELAVRGWQAGTGVDLLDALADWDELPLAGVLITDITVDGTLSGPDLEGYRLALGASRLPIIASGGVASAADLAALATLEVDGRRLDAVVVGKALLSGALEFEEAVAACAR